MLIVGILALTCRTPLDCSLNGVCAGGSCVCDAPWGGEGCGVLQYKPLQPVSASDLVPAAANTTWPRDGPCVNPPHPQCTAQNTWNGPIVGPVDGVYIMYNPLYARGSLLKTVDMLIGVSRNIEGPYSWRSLGQGDLGSNPAAVTYTDAGGKTHYTLWSGGKIRRADSPHGPFSEVGHYPSGNPAPLYHDGKFYMTSQRTAEVLTATAPAFEWWTHYADINVTWAPGSHREDPFMYIDQRGHWHIINHAFDTSEWKECGKSLLSAHSWSVDGKVWSSNFVNPYTHTVSYADGKSHTFTTLERPNLHFNASGHLTHINLAADLVSGDAGCKEYVKCPAKGPQGCACTNCKYADHAGSIIIALAV